MQVIEAGLMTLRDGALVALLANSDLRRIVTNTFISQKRYVGVGKLTESDLLEWISYSATSTLERYYVNGTYDLDTLELLLDVHFGLV